MKLGWTPPTTNTDGSPLTDLAGYRVYSGCSQPGAYQNRADVGPSVTTITLDLTGTCYAVVTAINALNTESARSNEAVRPGPPPPPPQIPDAPTAGPLVSWTAPPPVSVAVTFSNIDASVGELDIALTGSAQVTLALLGTVSWDWCKPGGEFATVVTPTSPALGVPNNDGVTAKAITLTAPVTTHCDYDPNVAFPGANVTVNGQTKPLVQSGNTWTVTF